jgi:hypothetical protein
MRDFAKDIKSIRKSAINAYNKQRNLILKDIKVIKKTVPAWKQPFRYYGTENQNVDQYFGVNEQLSPEILNKLDIINKMICNLAEKEFQKYFESYFDNRISLNNIKINLTYDCPSWMISYTEKVFIFHINGEKMNESEFINYLTEKYYYTETLNKIKKIKNENYFTTV